ncbi:MAG: tetratricopeptide repeat protein [Alphaproteobacteria bacterium]|nr:tetratricopeptide repeat protein [Alphaproteobacteria bacterium]
MIFSHRLAPLALTAAGALVVLVATSAPAIAANGDPSSWSGSYLAGRHAERQRDFGGAAAFLGQALAHEPTNFELLQRTHAALLSEGRFDDAVAMARRIVAQSSANAAANVTLAVDAVRTDRWDDAAKALSEIPLQGFHRLIVPLVRAWVDAGRGRADAIDQLKPLADLAEVKTIVDFHAGLIHERLGQVEAAEALLRPLAEREERLAPRIVEAVAMFYAAHGRLDEARAVVSRARAVFPDSLSLEGVTNAIEAPKPASFIADARAGVAAALFDMASAIRGEGDGLLSLPFGRYALAILPADPAALLLVGDILDQQRQADAANAMFGRIPPNTAIGWSARLRMAENLHQLTRTPEAVTLLEAMAEERPDRVDALITLGALKRVQEKYAEAAQVYDRAVARLPGREGRHWSLFYARGIAYERSKQWPKAEADFLAALELQPEQPDVLNYLAYSWVDQGHAEKYDRALKMLERAVELRPNSGHIIDSLAWALFRLGRHADSVPLLERAVELLPTEAVILDHLGDAYWQVGRRAEARYQWKRALDSKPEADLKPELEKKLRDGMAPPTPPTRGG